MKKINENDITSILKISTLEKSALYFKENPDEFKKFCNTDLSTIAILKENAMYFEEYPNEFEKYFQKACKVQSK